MLLNLSQLRFDIVGVLANITNCTASVSSVNIHLICIYYLLRCRLQFCNHRSKQCVKTINKKCLDEGNRGLEYIKVYCMIKRVLKFNH